MFISQTLHINIQLANLQSILYIFIKLIQTHKKNTKHIEDSGNLLFSSDLTSKASLKLDYLMYVISLSATCKPDQTKATVYKR